MQTKAAFDKLRDKIGAARPPQQHLINNNDEMIQMTDADGLMRLVAGPIREDMSTAVPPPPSLADSRDTAGLQLWIVRKDDVVYAEERCHFGTTLETGRIKHTNLTGGEPAYAGGEFLRQSDQTLIVNGRSGRYGPRSKEEMEAVGRAFRESGYYVWSMGYDTEADLPFPFLGVTPQWVP